MPITWGDDTGKKEWVGRFAGGKKESEEEDKDERGEAGQGQIMKGVRAESSLDLCRVLRNQ